jgi:hypothetical protein
MLGDCPLVDGKSLLSLLPNFSVDIFKKLFAPNLKVLIHVDVFAIDMANFAETVHVELPDERREVAVLEVPGQYFLREFGDVLDIEGVAGGSPADDRHDLAVLSHQKRTSTISSSLLMKRGIWLTLPFLLRLRFILIL